MSLLPQIEQLLSIASWSGFPAQESRPPHHRARSSSCSSRCWCPSEHREQATQTNFWRRIIAFMSDDQCGDKTGQGWSLRSSRRPTMLTGCIRSIASCFSAKNPSFAEGTLMIRQQPARSANALGMRHYGRSRSGRRRLCLGADSFFRADDTPLLHALQANSHPKISGEIPTHAWKRKWNKMF